MDEEFGKVLRLAPACDPTSLHIDPAEGFLLSRIDGQTPWRVLREMGAMSPEEVDMCLESWLARGIVEVDSARTEKENQRRKAPRPSVAAKRDPDAGIPSSLDESQIDEGLDIDVGVQRRILEFELILRSPYHTILGVARDADAKTIKKAYFKLSKEFHPDRFFRREIGSFAARLDRIFKKATEAYELLSDPATREEVQRSMDAVTPPSTPPPPSEPGAPPRPMTKIERLRARMPFRIPESVLAERRHKAKEFFGAARISAERGQYLEAAASVRLAIAFDPVQEEYKAAFGDIQAQASEMRAKKLLESSEELPTSNLKEALRLFEDVLLYRPHDPEVNDRAANLALKLDQVDKAREYVELAIEHSPDVARYHRTMALVYEARKERGHAVRELERALKLDPADEVSRRLMESLKPRGSRAGGGMR